MVELPITKIKATQINPKKIILFSKPKVGKSTAISELENCLLIDVENGANFLDAVKINVLEMASKEGITPVMALKQVINKIQASNKEKGDFVYKYGAIDTVSALEDIVLPLAKKLYQDTPMGRNFQGEDVTTLANGAGYQYSRKALWLVLDELSTCFETLIILAHVKDKMIGVKGEEISEKSISLIGKSAEILCSQVDAIGYVSREEGKTIVNFEPSENLVVGSRQEHLKNAKITLIESNESGKLIVDWSKIFI